MNKKNWWMIICIIISVVFLCGCQEPPDDNRSAINENIELESDIVDFVYADIIEHKEGGNVLRVDVEYLFTNIAGRIVSFNVNAEFYDVENNLLYTGGPKQFLNLAVGYSETVVNENFNKITYDGEDADLVDHVKIVIEEFPLGP